MDVVTMAKPALRGEVHQGATILRVAMGGGESRRRS